MIEFSSHAQGLAAAALIAEPDPREAIRALAEMRKSDDIIGATLVIEAWTRTIPTNQLVRFGSLAYKAGDPEVLETLQWVNNTLGIAGLRGLEQPKPPTLFRGVPDGLDLVTKASALWVDNYQPKTILDDIVEAIPLEEV